MTQLGTPTWLRELLGDTIGIQLRRFWRFRAATSRLIIPASRFPPSLLERPKGTLCLLA